MSAKRFVILLAGGSGSRMGSSINKILLPIAGVPCIIRSARALAPFADHMILVCRPQDETAIHELFARSSLDVPLTFCPGGNSRQDSVFRGLKTIEALAAPHNDPLVLIHDGARCLVPAEVIQSCVTSAETHGSGVAAVPVTDTLRQADGFGLSGETVPREMLYAMQTPQAFYLRPLLAAFRLALEDGFEGTDDASVMAHAGYPVRLSEGSRLNMKLTTQEDLIMAESILSSSLPPFRVGQGYDVHQLCERRKLILCGVEVPHSLGLLGHSDADVALHALMDALLGAAGLGDIGRHFPDTDDQYKGINSMKLLAAVMEKIHNEGFIPVNVDLTIVAQRPKLAPYIPHMTENVASSLGIPLSCVNVKATTTERLGFEGRMEGISAQAICLLQKSL